MNNSARANTINRGIRLAVIVAILALPALLTGLLTFTQPVRAINYVVININDSGEGSLRWAIDEANKTSVADIITFHQDTNGKPIILTGTSGEDGNATGDLDILGGGGDLTIQGNGAANTIIDGGGPDRVFHVCPGGPCAITVTFSGVTIRNGNEGYGGGIHIASGTTIVDSSAVSANASTYGGGIYNMSTLNVQNGSIIGGAGGGNQCLVGFGGGIYNASGTTTVDDSTVSANKAFHGGGIYNAAGTMTVVGSAVSGNATTLFGNGFGGGIFNSSGTTTVDGSTVSANTADYGGGINNTGTLIVQNGSTIGGAGAGNEAGYGGGIHNLDGTTTVTGSRILNNTAATNGGGVYNHRDVTGATIVTGSCIVGNSEKSFLNDVSAEQIATGNWWGAAGGPNTSGADTVDGNVDVDDHLTLPILGCAPDLQVSKGNDAGGNGIVGTPFDWTLTISNTGLISATFTAGQTILVDDLPAGPTYGAPAAGSFVDVDNSDNIQCSRAVNTITCAAIDEDVTLGPLTGSFEVTITVTPDVPATLFNPVKPAGVCKVDPDGNVTEDKEDNNVCPENVVNVLGPELQVGKSNDTGGNGVIGKPFNWTLTISNTGPSSATFDDLQTILKDDLPAGPEYGDPATGSFVDVTNGDKILCSVDTNTLTCKASGGKVTLGPLTGSFEVTLPVTSDAPATLVNPVKPDGVCQVDPDGNVPENDENNNDCPENTVDVSVSANFLYLPAVMK